MNIQKLFLTIAALALFVPSISLAESMPKMTGHFEKVDNGIKLMMMLDPGHPAAKRQTSAKLTFTDAQSGKPVDVKGVTVKWSMPEMGHDLKTKRAIPQREPGIFKSSIKFPMAGTYAATVDGTRDGKPVKMTFELHVMGESGHDMPTDKSKSDTHKMH